uniref:Uncharacterized protein n=1 Tax=Desertifilum tharense IPPAS B-1220 TaxID=1781255 RepID=A0ACD5GNM2_9CYAN
MLTSSTPELTVPELADLIQQVHLQCKASPTTGLLHARNAGEWLLAAKAVLSEEQWQTWLTTDCQLWENTYPDLYGDRQKLAQLRQTPCYSEARIASPERNRRTERANRG